MRQKVVRGYRITEISMMGRRIKKYAGVNRIYSFVKQDVGTLKVSLGFCRWDEY